MKKEQYVLKWRNKYDKPENNNNNNTHLPSISPLHHSNSTSNYTSLRKSTLRKPTKNFSNGNTKLYHLDMLSTFSPPQHPLTPSEMVEQSVIAQSKNNSLFKYNALLRNKVEKYIDYSDKYGGYYDIDDAIRKDVSKEEVGLSLPGNMINRRHSLGGDNGSNNNKHSSMYVQLVYPKFIKKKIATKKREVKREGFEKKKKKNGMNKQLRLKLK